MCNAELRTTHYHIHHKVNPDYLYMRLHVGWRLLNVSSLIGLALGNCLSRYVDQTKFMLIILTILFV
jgi:hypothetical protein